MFNFLTSISAKKGLVQILICLLLLVAIATRFYKLGEVPHGMTWDEAAIGYNGFAIFTTHRDEWLQKMPISFRSFGDYKAPLAIYINSLSTAALGLSLFAVRLPFALAGIVFIVSFGFYCRLLFYHSRHRTLLTILGLFFAVTSPWHLHFSRISFESGLALAMIMVGITGLEYLHQVVGRKIKPTQIMIFFLSLICLAASLYTYHSAKIFLPFFGILLVFRYSKIIFENIQVFLTGGIFFIALLYPLINDTFFGPGGARASVLITSQGLNGFDFVWMLLKNIGLHFYPEFLLFGKVDSLRHGTGSYGVLSAPNFLLAFSAIVWYIFKSKQISIKSKQTFILAITWILSGLLPAALSAEVVPHTNRALLALPGFLILALIGVELVLSIRLKLNQKLIIRLLVGLIVLSESILFIYLSQFYFSRFAQISANDFQDGYVEAFQEVVKYERGLDGYPEVSSIVIANQYSQPYIFALFVRKTSPIAYQGGSLGKYLFVDQVSVADLFRKNALLVATPATDVPIEKASKIIYGSDDQPRFLLYYTGNYD